MDSPPVLRRSTRRRSAAPPAPPEPTRGALTREAWTEAATEVLVDQGIDHVRVDVLSKQLGVTRGSFYWHFKDREELLRSVLQAWRERATEQLTQRLERARDDAHDQLRDVLSLPFRGRAARRGARIELAIRAWARRDELARHAVDEADAARIGYIAQIFSALGFPIAEARHRAFITYAHVVAESVMPGQGGPAALGQRQERTKLFEALMLASLGG
jgi:AcrR family transcriptional regulator